MEHYPDMWDVTVGGHLREGEDGAREVAEELGANVNLDDLQFVGIASMDNVIPGGHDREKPRVYLWHSGRTIDSFTFADGEVVGLACVALGELGALLGGTQVPSLVFDGVSTRAGTLAPDTVVTHSPAYWTLVRGALGEDRA